LRLFFIPSWNRLVFFGDDLPPSAIPLRQEGGLGSFSGTKLGFLKGVSQGLCYFGAPFGSTQQTVVPLCALPLSGHRIALSCVLHNLPGSCSDKFAFSPCFTNDLLGRFFFPHPLTPRTSPGRGCLGLLSSRESGCSVDFFVKASPPQGSWFVLPLLLPVPFARHHQCFFFFSSLGISFSYFSGPF